MEARNGLKIPIRSVVFEDAAIGNDSAIISNLNHSFEPGKITWVTGGSGTGKSTVLRTLAGAIFPLSGKYLINGNDVGQMTFEEFLPFRINIGYSFELGGLLHNRTLWDNLMLPLLYHRPFSFEEAEKKAERLVRLFHLEKFKNERPSSVPGGMRKAACVARAFVLEPEVLLLDEPTAGLNEEGVEALEYLLIEGLRTNPTTMVISSRNKAFMEKWADTELRLSFAKGAEVLPVTREESGAA